MFLNKYSRNINNNGCLFFSLSPSSCTILPLSHKKVISSFPNTRRYLETTYFELHYLKAVDNLKSADLKTAGICHRDFRVTRLMAHPHPLTGWRS